MFCKSIRKRNDVYVYIEKDYNVEPMYGLQLLNKPFVYSSKPIYKMVYYSGKDE